MSDPETEPTTVVEEEYSLEEHKYPKISLRTDNEFYHDDDNIVYDVFEVKRKATKKEEYWDILKNKESFLRINATELQPKEIAFIRSVPGVQFTLSVFKSGVKTLEQFRKLLEEKL